MKTLDEHNKDIQEYHIEKSRTKYNSGILCPKCKTEMWIENPGVICASNPPCRWVICPECKYRSTQIL